MGHWVVYTTWGTQVTVVTGGGEKGEGRETWATGGYTTWGTQVTVVTGGGVTWTTGGLHYLGDTGNSGYRGGGGGGERHGPQRGYTTWGAQVTVVTGGGHGPQRGYTTWGIQVTVVTGGGMDHRGVRLPGGHR